MHEADSFVKSQLVDIFHTFDRNRKPINVCKKAGYLSFHKLDEYNTIQYNTRHHFILSSHLHRDFLMQAS